MSANSSVVKASRRRLSSDMLRTSSHGSEHFAPDKSSMRDKHKDNKSIRDLTINKLNYQAIGLVGREKEVETLRSCLFRFSRDPVTGISRKKELVLIRGYSGIGKSKIALTAKAYAGDINNGTGVCGKFDQYACDEPYSGISTVFGELCEIIMDGIETRTRHKLASLENYPSLEDSNHGHEADFERLKYAFRVLTRLLCAHFSPLVFILDDLQWADTASLKTIDALLSDIENKKGLVIIGVYRSNEVSEAHPLVQTIKFIESKGATFGINITNMEIQSLCSNDINEIIMAMLGIDDDSLLTGLAEICYRRTLGNPFFVIEFITMLEVEGMLSFNLGLLKWTWNEKLIEEKTMPTAHVVDLLQARMRRLPDHLQVVLQYAACLGAEFNISVLEIIVQQSPFTDAYAAVQDDIRHMLQRLARDNFIEAFGTTSYRLIHDKIQEAALTFGSALEPSFQYDVGWILYCNLSGSKFEEMLFDVANLINKGNHTHQRDFAKLNLRAAERARRASAFHSASAYVTIGIKLLPDSKWTDHSSLTLKLYTLGAEMAVALGNADMVQTYVTEVLSQSHVSMLQKLPVYIAKSIQLSNIDRQYNEALSFLCQGLNDFGYWVPRGIMQPFHVVRVLRRTVNAAKKRPICTYKTPKLMTDPNHEAAMLFLSRIFNTTYFIGNKFLYVFSACKLVQMTLDHGVSPLSGQGYAALGTITNAMRGDFGMSSFLAETALTIQEAVHSKYLECQTIFIVSSFILPWSKPMQSQLSLLRRGYSLGMRSGNVEYALWCQYNISCVFHYMMGKPLLSIDRECAKHVPQMEEFQQNGHARICRSAWQLALNLMGEGGNDILLQGSAFEQLQGDSTVSQVVQRYQTSDLYLFFGEYELAAKSALDRGEECNELLGGSALVMLETFHRAIALYAMARKTKKSKYSKPAHRIRKRIARWVKSGNPNVKHYDSFLQAERAALRGKQKKAKRQYEEAIKLAARTGHMHHAALFNERFADFLQIDLEDEEESAYRSHEAIRWYGEWGALRKVELLQAAQDQETRWQVVTV